MADHAKPTASDSYANWPSLLAARINDLAVWLDPAVVTPTNLPDKSVRWSSALKTWQKLDGGTWGDLSDGYAIPIVGGSVNNSPVGATTPSTGAFTTLTASGNAALSGALGVGGANQFPAQYGLHIVSQLASTNTSGATSEPTITLNAPAGSVNAYTALPKTAAAAITVNKARAFQVVNATKGAGSTINEQIGLDIPDLTSGTSNNGITLALSAGANKRALNSTGTADSYHAGNIGIGTQTITYRLNVAEASIDCNSEFKTSKVDGLTQILLTNDARTWVIRNNGANADGFEIRDATGGATRLNIDTSGHLLPGADNAQNLGSASKRLKEIFAGNNVINTSDGTLKQIRGELTAQEIAAWSGVRWRIYQWRDAVEQKGEDAARLHAGLIAQEVAAAFAAAGLDVSRYALWCADEIFEDVEVSDGIEVVDVPVMETVEVIDERIEIIAGTPTLVRTPRMAEQHKHELRTVFDASGNVVWEEVHVGEDAAGKPLTERRPVQHSCPVFEVRTRPKVRIEKRSLGYRYGLRYGQCDAFEAAYQRARAAQAEARIADLESRLSALEGSA